MRNQNSEKESGEKDLILRFNSKEQQALRREFLWQWGLCALFFAFLITFYESSSLDLSIQDKFFDSSTRQWLIDRHNVILKFVFYQLPKNLLILAGLILLYNLIRKKEILGLSLRQMLFVFLCLGLVPLMVSGLKQYTNVYCPDELIRYGGSQNYRKLLDPPCITCEQGKCFPAGHSTVGFVWMSLYFLGRSRKEKLAGLIFGTGAGYLLGTYQMLKGVHFLSHTLFSHLFAWMLILLIGRMVYPEGLKPEIQESGAGDQK